MEKPLRRFPFFSSLATYVLAVSVSMHYALKARSSHSFIAVLFLVADPSLKSDDIPNITCK